jgi:ATP-dependent helicase/nuclease subunit B
VAFRPAQPLILEALATGENLLVMGPAGSGKSTGLLVGIADGLLRQQAPGPSVLYLSDRADTTAWAASFCQACGLLAGQASELAGAAAGGDRPDVLFVSPSQVQSLLSGRHDWTNLRLLVIDDLSTVLGSTRGAHLSVVLERLLHGCPDPRRVALSSTLGNPEVALEWLRGGSQRAARVLRVPGTGGRKLLEVELVGQGSDPVEIAAVKVRGRGALIEVDSSATLQALEEGLERKGLRCQGQTRDCELSLGTVPTRPGFPQVLSFAPAGSVRDLLSTLALTRRDPNSVSRVCLAAQTEQDFLAACAAVSLAGKRWVEPVEPESDAWSVYLQQLVVRILDGNGLTVQQALEDQGQPWALKDLHTRQRQEVLEHLVSQGLLQHAAGRLVLGPRGEAAFDNALWRQTGRAFWRPQRYVIQTSQEQHAASLDSWFLEVFPDLIFPHAGHSWQVDEVRPQAGLASARRVKSGAMLSWSGPLRLYHPELCAEIRSLLISSDEPAFLERRQLRVLRRLREQWGPLMAEPRSHQLPTFAGARANALLAKLHHHLTGETVTFNNILISTSGSGQSLSTTLERLAMGLTLEDQERLVHGCRYDDFLDLLPPAVRAQHLLQRFFDVQGARDVAEAMLKALPEAPPTMLAPDRGPDDVGASPAGDPFFHQLVSLARTQRTRNKWIFVPEISLHWMLAERLLHSGADWVNFRFHTPFQVALDMAAPYLVQAGVHPKPEGLGPDLIMKLLLALPPDQARYFRPLAHQGGLARPLWKAIQELRLAGVTAEQLNVEMFSTADKGRELKALLGAYERYLDQHRLGDRATIFLAAIERAEEAPVKAGDLVLESPYQVWSALERRFLDAIGGHGTAAWVIRGDPPRRWAALSSRREIRPAVIEKDCHLLSLLSTSRFEPPRHDGTLQFFCAGRRDAEIQEILRRVLQRGLPLDQVELVVHDPDSQALLWDKLQKHGLPASFAAGLPAGATAPGRAILGLLQWSESSFACFFLRELLLAGLLQCEGQSAAVGARYLERAKATWGRETYALHLGQLEAWYRSSAEARDVPDQEARVRTEQAQAVAGFAAWVQRLLQRLPSPGNPSLDHLIEGLLCILQQEVPLRGALDGAARTSIARALRDLRLLADHSWTSEQCHRLIREKMESLTVGAGRPEAGKLYITSPPKMGRSGRRHLFLFGLEAGSLTVDSAEDPILCDSERRQIHSSLELSTDRAEENRFRLQQQLSSLDCEVTMSYSCRDFSSGEELLPSRLFFDAARLLYPQVNDYDRLAEALGEPLTLAPPTADQAAGDAEWWLAKLVGCGEESQTTVLAGFPWLSRGYQAQLHRESPLFTAFDGWVPAAANLFVPGHTTDAISVSRLQDLASCPFRAFLKMALKARPLELERPNPDRWLTAAERGTALHETFAAYYRHLRKASSRPSAADFETLVALLEVELERVRKVLPAPSLAVERAEREQLHRDLRLFLKLELDDPREVVGCEVGFGMPDTDDEPLATVDPVLISLADDVRFLLRGRMDRIDKVQDGYEVIDYKTGRQLTDADRPHYHQGQLLQHALYALVAEALLAREGGTVRASSYYFPVVRARKNRVRFSYPDKAVLAEVLRLVLEPLRTGAFAHTNATGKDCTYCDFRAACVAQDDQRMAAKQDDATNIMLDCRKRLRSIR